MFTFACEMSVADTHRVCQPLKLAVAVSLADVAVLGVVIQKQLDNVTPGLAKVLCIGMYFHAVEERISTGGDVVFHSFDFDYADPARAFYGKLGVVA